MTPVINLNSDKSRGTRLYGLDGISARRPKR